ncbi:MAG: RES family NAD+ phosphorylase [Ignavibacteriales bacterium]|nr:RES family NAD+ phosphorylase [Ignavibacteriales bacterium]
MKKIKTICSNCFEDEGLRLVAICIGYKNKTQCSNCGSIDGYKLNKNRTLELCHIYFVRGTTHRTSFGGAPIIQFNTYHKHQSSIHVSERLQEDIKLLEQIADIGFFYYGPNMWMVGEITPLLELQQSKTREQGIAKILEQYPTYIMKNKSYVYRVRVNPKLPNAIEQYDSPPVQYLGTGRLDSKGFPVLYCSTDFELCVHECRVTVEDEVYMAKLILNEDIKLLDLTAELNEDIIPFDSLGLAVRYLFLAQKNSYRISRRIAKMAADIGYGGIIYPSYFSLVKAGSETYQPYLEKSLKQITSLEKDNNRLMPNIAIFGCPIKSNKLFVDSINRIMMNKIMYDLTFGPVIYPSEQ